MLEKPLPALNINATDRKLHILIYKLVSRKCFQNKILEKHGARDFQHLLAKINCTCIQYILAFLGNKLTERFNIRNR